MEKSKSFVEKINQKYSYKKIPISRKFSIQAYRHLDNIRSKTRAKIPRTFFKKINIPSTTRFQLGFMLSLFCVFKGGQLLK